MKTEIDILKLGDEILTKEKENPNHITTQLNKDETISYNTGFKNGFLKGYMANEKTVKTVIQLTNEVPFVVFTTYDFLYTPSQTSVIKINNKKHMLVDSSDVIDAEGNITRYLKYY
jgi:hypothetical protein